MQRDTDIMDAYTVVFDGLDQLGPGDPATTRRLLERLHSHLPSAPRVADLGCGVGASALVLARCLPGARVLAVDAHAPFIARLEAAAGALGLRERICPVVGDMSAPPPLDGRVGGFDLMWSESAVYGIGRVNAFDCWRPLLEPEGLLVFSEVVWRCAPTERSDRASAFWSAEYPDIATAADVLGELAAGGFEVLDTVSTGRAAWANYYEPLRDRLRALSAGAGRTRALDDLIAGIEEEIDVYDSAGDEVALHFFVAKRAGSLPEPPETAKPRPNGRRGGAR